MLLAAPAARAAVSDDEIARYADQLFSQAVPADEPEGRGARCEGWQGAAPQGVWHGQPRAGVPIQPDMVFKIASVTKQFTAAAILLLQERGKLSVDDEITKHLPPGKKIR